MGTPQKSLPWRKHKSDKLSKARDSSYRAHFLKKKTKNSHDVKEEVKTLEKHSEVILNGIEVLWRQNLMCDVLLITSGKTLSAHKLVLVSCSEFFYEELCENSDSKQIVSEIHLPGISSCVLESILECLYTGKIHFAESTIEDILSVASRLGFCLVMDICEDFLINHISKENALRYLDLSFRYGLDHLSDRALGFVADNFKLIAKHHDFLHLPVEQLISLLKRDDLNTRSEFEVFHKVLEWTAHKKNDRFGHIIDLMNTVRLPLLNPVTVMDQVETVDYLMEIPDIQSLVKEALHYHCIPARQTMLQVSTVRIDRQVHFL